MRTDGLTIVDEKYPVEGYSQQQITQGAKIVNSVQDKLLSIAGELLVGTSAKWIIVNTIRLRALRLSFGISAAGNPFTIGIKKNNVVIASNLVVPAGVLVMEFPISELSSRDFVLGDSFEIYVHSVAGSRSAYHMTAQIDYVID